MSYSCIQWIYDKLNVWNMDNAWIHLIDLNTHTHIYTYNLKTYISFKESNEAFPIGFVNVSLFLYNRNSKRKTVDWNV